MKIAMEAKILRKLVRQYVGSDEVPAQYRELVQALADDNMPAYYAQVRRLEGVQ